MTIAIVIVALLSLVALHELGHFLMAKRFRVKVEEFGIGLPPRLGGIRFGETLYSLNLLPLGAFVRLEGEEGSGQGGPRSYSAKSLGQRMLIVAGGVIAFWLISFVIFSGLFATLGMPTAVADGTPGTAQVQILGVAAGSPAAAAGIRAGDVIESIEGAPFGKVSEVQNRIIQSAGKEVEMRIKQGREVKNLRVAIRESAPAGEGLLGVGLARTMLVSYPFGEAIWKGAGLTLQVTMQVVEGLWRLVAGVASFQGVPQGVEFMGVVGIVDLLSNAFAFGWSSFLSLLGLLSVYLAVFNALPIPAVDGGKLLFLAMEGVRKKPISPVVEQRIHASFFLILLVLLIVVTVQDIFRIFGT